MDTLLHDLRFGLKLLWKEKLFSATVLLTLAVCIGANTTIFSVINAVLLKPLPYEEPQELVTLFNSYPGAGAERASNAAPDFFFRRDEIDAFQELAAFQSWGHTVGEPGSTERARTLRVTSTFLNTLQVSPALGRNFTWEEMEPGNHRKVILSHAYWQDRFGGAASVLGQDLRVDREPYTIVGVLPEDFRLAWNSTPRDFLVPIPMSPEQRAVDQLHNNNFSQIARLAQGATLEQARSQLQALNARLSQEWPVPNASQILEDAGFHSEIHLLKDDMIREIRPSLLMLWAGVAFVLLIGCVNIANLMLARSNVRMRELATRLALGADRFRVGKQLLTEAVLLGVLGGILGLLVGWAGVQVMGTLGVQELPRGTQVSLDVPVLLFTLALGLGAGVLFGSIPLLNVMRSDLSGVFRTEGRSGTASRRAVFLRSGLVTAQVAVAFILLIGAGLMARSFRQVVEIDPGFQPQGVLAGYVALPDARYPDDPARLRFMDDLLREVRALPGVQTASVTSQIPFGGSFGASVIMPEGYAPRPGESLLSPFRNHVGTDYFELMGIPLLEGRTFQELDHEDDARVIILDEWLANRYFPDESPLGKRMLYGAVPGIEEDLEPYMYTIVGVVGSVRQNDLVESNFVGAYYFPMGQNPDPSPALVVKADADPTPLVSTLRETVAELDPELPFYSARTMQERIDESLVARRSPMLLLMIFAGVALFLAAVGIYGALAYSVTQRTKEMGIRIAMGSSAGEVFRLVVLQGLKVVGVGLVLGGVGALVLVRLIQSLLYGVEPADPAVMGSVAVLLAMTGLLACLLPARRATRIDPVVALTTE